MNDIATAYVAGCPLADVVTALLTWQDAGNVHAELEAVYRRRLETRWQEALTMFVRAGVGQRLTRLVEGLTAEGVHRLLSAPETSRRLLYDRPTDLGFFLRSAMAEQARANFETTLPEPVWTALGDEYFPAGEHQMPAHRPTEPSFDWNEAVPFCSARVCGRIPLDHVSPHASRGRGLLPATYAPLSAGEAKATATKLTLALDQATKVSAEAAGLIDASVRVIVPRKDAENLESYGSMSADRFIGRVGFVNPQEPHVDEAQLADGLVHEAIHSFLYKLELDTPLAHDREAAEEQKVLSPWSGRLLSVHTFFHATLIWHALWHFWRLALEHGVFALSRAEHFLHRSAVGFSSPVMNESQSTALPHLRPEWGFLADVVGTMTGATG